MIRARCCLSANRIFKPSSLLSVDRMRAPLDERKRRETHDARDVFNFLDVRVQVQPIEFSKHFVNGVFRALLIADQVF